MARDHARIRVSVWTDPDFTRLTRNAQWLYTAILSQPTLSYAGVTTFTVRRLVRLSGDATEHDIAAGLAELQAGRFVLVDADTDEVWVRSFVKNDGVLKSPNLLKRMVTDVAAIMSPTIREAFGWEWHRDFAVRVTPDHATALTEALDSLPATPSRDPWETLPPPLPETVPATVPQRVPRDSGNPSGTGSPTRAAPAPTPAPSPSPAATPTAEPSNDANAGQLMAAHLEACTQRPPNAVVGQTAKETRKLLEEGHRPADVAQALTLLRSKGTHPSTLPSLLNEVLNPPRRTTRPPAAVNGSGSLDRHDPAVWGAQ